MSASNKLIFSLAQNLDIDEKNQARKNIGAVGCFGHPFQTVTHTVTNDESQQGSFDITLSNKAKGRYFLRLSMYSGDNDGLQSDRYPFRITSYINLEGGGQLVSELASSSLDRLDSPGTWYSIFTALLDNTSGTATSIVLHFYFGTHKIQANTTITTTIFYHLVSETEPS